MPELPFMTKENLIECKYLVTYFGGDDKGGIMAGQVSICLPKPIVINTNEDLNSLKVNMIRVKPDLRGKNFGIMGIIPIGKEL